MNKNLISLQTAVFELNGLLFLREKDLEVLSIKDQMKIKKLQSMLLDIDSMLDDYTT